VSIGIEGDSVELLYDEVTYIISPNTFDDTVYLSHKPLLATAFPPSDSLVAIRNPFEVSAIYSDTMESALPSDDYGIRVKYKTNRLEEIDVDTLALYYWDGFQWVQEPSTVNTNADLVSAVTSHMGIMALLAKPRQYIYLPQIVRD
jgi:hypothetical protein